MSDTMLTLILTGLGGAVMSLAGLLWREALGWKKERDEAREELKQNNNAILKLTEALNQQRQPGDRA